MDKQTITKNKLNSGLSIHCHHNILVEYCYDYNGRVDSIKNTKPENEQETRLRLFKILPKEAEKDLPERYLKAYAEWQKADAEWQKAFAEWQKAFAELRKAYAEWSQKSRDAFHKKWCGCSEWNGKELVFNSKKL